MTLPRTMKAAILVEQRQPLVIDQIELPNSLDVGQVLVKVHFSGICGSQLGEIEGVKGEDAFLPHLLGHEASGEVLSVGPGVKQVKPGQTVVMHWRKSIGVEANPPRYRWQGKNLNAGWITTFNEYAIVSENRLTAIPENSDLKVAALFGCAVTTGFGIIENNAKVRLGESVVVFGAGGIGLNIIQAAALSSAYPIIAIDKYADKLPLAKAMGATHSIHSHETDVKSKIQDIIGKNGLDIFIDNTGNPSVIELGYELTHAQGRVILVGVPRKGEHINIYSLPLHFGKIMQGSHGGETIPHMDIPRYQKLFDMGKMKLRELITNVYSLDEINQAIQEMREGKVRGRCLIEM